MQDRRGRSAVGRNCWPALPLLRWLRRSPDHVHQCLGSSAVGRNRQLLQLPQLLHPSRLGHCSRRPAGDSKGWAKQAVCESAGMLPLRFRLGQIGFLTVHSPVIVVDRLQDRALLVYRHAPLTRFSRSSMASTHTRHPQEASPGRRRTFLGAPGLQPWPAGQAPCWNLCKRQMEPACRPGSSA